MNTRLIKLRIERGLNQKEAADKIGISQSMLSALEQGHRSGSDTVKIKIANFYGQSVESIFLLIKSRIVIEKGGINMSPLINIQVKNNNQLVSARELHKNLGLTTRFSKWVDQNFENFEKEQDFTSVTTVTVGITSTYVENTKIFCTFRVKLWDHLHIRGEYLQRHALTMICGGSPPQYTTWFNHHQRVRGSPPHTWRILKDPLSLSHFNFMKTKIYSVSSYLFYSFLFISSTHFKFFLPI